jgi:hypothetical protein
LSEVFLGRYREKVSVRLNRVVTKPSDLVLRINKP